MRVTVKIDSATPTEVFNLTAAFQRTLEVYDNPQQATEAPTVTVLGSAMGWESPAITVEHARELMAIVSEGQREQALSELRERLAEK